jgi:hypothetical protein
MLVCKKMLAERELPIVRAVVAYYSRAPSQHDVIDPQRTRPSPPDDTTPIYSFNGERTVCIR